MGEVIHSLYWIQRRAALDAIPAALEKYHAARNVIPVTQESRKESFYELGRVRGLRYCTSTKEGSELYWKVMTLGENSAKVTVHGCRRPEYAAAFLQGYMETIFEIMEKVGLYGDADALGPAHNSLNE